MIARRLGLSVVLIERARHPRFAIGESSTPLANLLIEELATRYDLPAIGSFAKWGTWQGAHPDIACGLKRGFSFFHHRFDTRWRTNGARANQLLVAASPRDEIADTHWLRADFDHFFAMQARELGAHLIEECTPISIGWNGGLARICCQRRTMDPFLNCAYTARFVVDASGPWGFLSQALQLPQAPRPARRTEALYSHFSGVGGFAAEIAGEEKPPFPLDAAALHHIFDGGWIWVLHFNNGLTSAGAAVTAPLAGDLKLHEGAASWERLLCKLPSVRAQFAESKAVRPFAHNANLAYRCGAMVGQGWALLPSAAGFTDPLLSTGFPLTLLGVERIARALHCGIGSREFERALEGYARETDEELRAAERLMAALYANMGHFPTFRALTLLYFAAASFSETLRRLGKPGLASGFLLQNHVRFGPSMREICVRARHLREDRERDILIRDIHRLIEPFDIAGLGAGNRCNWYPVLAEDLFRSAHKVGATAEEIKALLVRAGFLD